MLNIHVQYFQQDNNYEQYGPRNIVEAWYTADSAFLAVYIYRGLY